jgi:hypothetical protein
MRRGCSVILLILGGWILGSVGVMGLMPPEQEISPWVFVGMFAAFAAPFLLIGTWMSPGRRWPELGLTLMIAAGVSAFLVLTMAALSYDTEFQKLMPEPMPKFDFTASAMIVSILAIGGGGYLLWRLGQRRN